MLSRGYSGAKKLLAATLKRAKADNMRGDQDSGFLAPSDIAELAGVSRAAVSNWRRRELDFPEPVGGTKANPLFDRVDVERWLAGRRPQQPRADRVSGGMALWSVMNGYRRDMPMHSMQTLALSVLCARKLAAGSDHAEELRREASRGRFLQATEVIAETPDADKRWRELVSVEPESLSGRGFDRLTGDLYRVVDTMNVEELAKAADFVLNRVGAREGRTAGEHGAVGSRMSRLLAEVAASGASSTMTTAYDPACGIGEALIEFWRRSPHRDRLHLFGTEIDEDYARICRQRCFLYGATATVECGDVLVQDPLPDLSADIVMAEPPFGLELPPGFSLADPRWSLAGLPPKGDADTAWIQHVIAHLAPRGHGLIVTGLSATSNPASTPVRRALVQRGCVDAVVVLPRKLLTYTPIQTALWILRTPDRPEGSEEIMFIDASLLNPGARLDLQMLSSSDCADNNPDTLSASIEAEEILADEQLRLDPRYWTRATVDPGELEDRYRTAIALLDHALEAIAETEYEFAAVPPASRMSTVRELERLGALTIIRGGKPQPYPTGVRADRDPELWQEARSAHRLGRFMIPGPGSPRVVTPKMVRDGLPQRGAGGGTPVAGGRSDSEMSSSDATDTCTRPGDVLVVNGRAVVDDDGGWIPGVGVTRVVVDPHHFVPQYVADCLNSSWSQLAESASSMAIYLRDLEIPLIPLADQQRIVEEFRQSRELASNGRLLADAAEEVVSVRLDAIRHEIAIGGASFSGRRVPAGRPAKGESPFGAGLTGQAESNP